MAVALHLLANSLQGVEGALDVSDLSCKHVDGLHGAVKLLATSHQCIHSLQATHI